MKRRYVAIDPDMRKSGVCVLDGRELVSVASLPFPDVLDLIAEQCAEHEARVLVEAGWLECHNWHVQRGDSPTKAAAIGRSVGMNHQTGMLIVEWCRAHGYKVDEIHPLKKCWRGRDGKITQEELRIATGLVGLPSRMNQDARDAVLMAWVCAGNPVRVATVRSKPKTNG